jgi:pimeloyl-ACP methyl ester carboxylesterase
MFEYLSERSNANDNLSLHQSYRRLALELRVDSAVSFVEITAEQVRVSAQCPADGVDVTLSATTDAWEQQREVAPARGFQALSTMRRLGHLEVSGDLLAFNQNLLMLEMLFTPSARQTTAPRQGASPYIEPVLGRYLNLDVGGRAQRIYFEEAGSGIPLLCLHTAGADARQYRAILNDADITKNFRVIAFDLPWHGKSSPPVGFETEVYQLTTDSYVEVVMAVAQALELDTPVIMGCSIGGRVVIHLALRHGQQLGGVIGLQSALYAEDKTGNVEAGSRMVLNRPDVHGGKIAAALMNGVMAPQSPVAERWETMWHYMQGGPGIFMGDLNYYFADGDLRNAGVANIDTTVCPVYLLSGEYDPSATPEMGQELADLIGADHFEVMREMGHFPMSENPELFREYLMPVLEKIVVARNA